MSNSQLIQDIRRAAGCLVASVILLNLAFIALTALRGYPVWWWRFMGESNMWTRGTALELMACGALCFFIFVLRRYQRKHGLAPHAHSWIWLAMAGGFPYLAMDELFMVHERLEGVYGVDDAFAVLGYVIAAAVLAVPLVRDLSKARGALRLFLTGIGFAGASAVLDNLAHTRGPLMAVEEILELLGVCAFLAALTTVLMYSATEILASADMLTGSPRDVDHL